MIELTYSEDDNTKRLDKFIAEKLTDNSRSYYQRLIKNGNITVNGVVCTNQRQTIVIDDVIEIKEPEAKEKTLIAEDIPLDVLYEDDAILVINKPHNMVVHPAIGNWKGTVVNGLLHRYPDFETQFTSSENRPGIVHRLDKDTSGCLVIAKNEQIQFKLSQIFADRLVGKTYLAVVYGHSRLPSGKIVTLIGRHPVSRKKMAVVTRRGKESITHYRVLKSGIVDTIPMSFLEVDILTGRTHQIRVHLAYKKMPVLGDSLYGGRQKHISDRQLLHAYKLSFPHPVTGEEMSFEAPVPSDMQQFVDQF